MAKIKMENPIVEMDGDEMTRVLWQWIKADLLEPFIELNTEYYDLGLVHRDETEDKVTIDATNAIKKHKVGVKCATITPNAQRVEEYDLKKMWKSPNGTLRGILDGTVIRSPIVIDAIKPAVSSWKAPIHIARHAYGDVYSAIDYRAEGPGEAQLVFTDKNGESHKQTIYDFEGPGLVQCMHNKDSSIESFAHVCFKYALENKLDLWFSAKDTISKIYDQSFKLIFEDIYEKHYKEEFEANNIEYFYTLIDDAIARVIRSEGGFVWACKNYDGDVMSDMISTAFGSLAMMTSVLQTPNGEYEYEAAHGTVTRHYYRYQKGEETSTNPMATIFAWSGALRKRGELDGSNDLVDFANKLEKACIDTLNSGIMTGDLASLSQGITPQIVNSREMILAIKTKLQASI